MDTLNDWGDALITSLASAMAMLFSAVPKILGFLIILVAGWVIASALEKAVGMALRTVRFNELSERSGLSDFVRKMGADTDASGLIATVVKWFIRLIALVVAFDALGLPAVSDVLRRLLLWLPNAVVAVVVLVIGGLAARALSNIVRGAAAEGGLDNPYLLAKVAHTLVWAFAIVVAVNQIGIATELVNTLFMAFVGAIALATGLAFGLGGRDTAAEVVRMWWNQGRRRADALGRTAEAASSRMGAASTGATGNLAAENNRPGSENTPGSLGGGVSGSGWRPSPAGPRLKE